jgi:DNA replication licensing factor MCM5
VRQPYIRVVGIEEVNEASSRGHAAFTKEEVELEITVKTA